MGIHSTLGILSATYAHGSVYSTRPQPALSPSFTAIQRQSPPARHHLPNDVPPSTHGGIASIPDPSTTSMGRPLWGPLATELQVTLGGP